MLNLLYKVAVKHKTSVDEVKKVVDFQFKYAAEHVQSNNKARLKLNYLFSLYWNQKYFDKLLELKAAKIEDDFIKENTLTDTDDLTGLDLIY